MLSFSLDDKFSLLGYAFTRHVTIGHAPSPSSLTFSPSTILIGSISKLLLSAWK